MFSCHQYWKKHLLTLKMSDTTLHTAFIKQLRKHAKEALTTKRMTNRV